MGGPLYFDAAFASAFIAGAVQLGASVFLWVVGRRGLMGLAPSMRALALVLFILAGDFLCAAFRRSADAAGDVATSEQWGRAQDRFSLVLDLAAFWFLLQYPKARTWLGRTRGGAALFILAGVIIEAILLLDPDARQWLSAYTILPTFALIALFFLVDYTRAVPGPGRAGRLIASAAFGAYGTWAGWAWLSGDALVLLGLAPATEPISVINRMARISWEMAGLLLVGSAFALWHSSKAPSNDGPRRQESSRYLAAVVVPAAFGVALALVRMSAPNGVAVWMARLTDHIIMAALPLLLTYAVVRHRLFGLEVALRFTVKRGTLAVAFVAVFFVVAAVAQAFLQSHLSWILGGVATGFLVFALAPLQRAAERLADAAFPGVKPLAAMDEGEKASMYRDLAAAAWEDGSLSLAERRVLQAAQHRLGVSAAAAQALEAEAISGRKNEAARRKRTAPP